MMRTHPKHKSIEGIPIDEVYSNLEMDILPEYLKTFCSIVTEKINMGLVNHMKEVTLLTLCATIPNRKTEKCFVAKDIHLL